MSSSSPVIRRKAKYVVGYKDGDHHIYQDGEVVYQDNTVIFVGHDYEGHIDTDIDEGNALIGPGFIDLDAIVDLDSTVLAFDNQPGWKKGRVPSKNWQRRETYTPEQLAFNKLYSFNMLLMNGITTAAPITSILYREWAETYDEFVTAADIAEQTGIRAVLGPAYMSGYSVTSDDGKFSMRFNEERGLAGLRDAARFISLLENDYSSRITGMLAPDRIEGCTPKLLRESAAVRNDLDCTLRLHSCQGPLEVDMVDALHDGKSSIELINSCGLLSNKTLLPHLQLLGGKNPTEDRVHDELQLIGQAGASAVICPLVAGRHAKYFSGLTRFQSAGINIALGTDTYPVDMIQNMHVGCILSRVTEQSITEASAADYYRAATIGGAKALGREDIGRLCRGSKADLIVFDFASPFTGQLFDPITTLVINGNGRDVRSVIVDGILVVDNHKLKNGNDMAHLHAKAQDQYQTFMGTFPERCPGTPALDEIFQPSFRTTQSPANA
ncbi:chlorohydrolase family protein [Qingshengfaniella alkalisoli]|uniref:Amidohydrolase family protein n=1 Tax=Qingshengfaniella alkalisoli TaxID=2599296 RepID=A0A5B8I8U3_9RHOB|nr:chlorohydrolase family protein [Qingshengfaniella alkalisoli]QDY70505.1 amidohydrolase family protein [Qingshengfaniella alkalisoli]